jgi:catechol 2,3-dioxygenase-like lactoylglutathione lyase family enzyme
VTAHFILYVEDQAESRRFYDQVLDRKPALDVPGMTEYRLAGGAVLGLMPMAGVRRLLGSALPDVAEGTILPRAELYLVVEDPGRFHDRALSAGARELSPLLPRDWGHEAAYSLDRDGHVLAFAREAAGGNR